MINCSRASFNDLREQLDNHDTMRTSRISRDTAKVIEALSPSKRTTRQTRSALSAFAHQPNGAVAARRSARTNVVKKELDSDDNDDDDDASSLSSAPSTFSDDIEDLMRPSKRRKRDADATVSIKTTASVKQSPRKPILKQEEDNEETKSPTKKRAPRKIPARKIKAEDGETTISPPSNWETMYNIVREMRKRNPTAPVDTMGCEDLFHHNSSPRDRRFQTLTALMLSSQTKDTVTAAAMKRLHTELGTSPPDDSVPSTCTLEHVLAAEPAHLNKLIGAVGFHNNKTKYIKATALMLRDEYNSDIPNTPEGLMRLPGVGPKMAYLCMSAAWGIDVGIGVDVHVHRITNLWGWQKTKTPEETRLWLEAWLPKEKWHEINKMLVGLGQLVCLPVGRRCGECDLQGTGLCKGEVRGWVDKRVKKAKVEVEVEVKGEEGEVGVVKEEVETKIKVEDVEGV